MAAMKVSPSGEFLDVCKYDDIKDPQWISFLVGLSNRLNRKMLAIGDEDEFDKILYEWRRLNSHLATFARLSESERAARNPYRDVSNHPDDESVYYKVRDLYTLLNTARLVKDGQLAKYIYRHFTDDAMLEGFAFPLDDGATDQ